MFVTYSSVCIQLRSVETINARKGAVTIDARSS